MHNGTRAKERFGGKPKCCAERERWADFEAEHADEDHPFQRSG